MIRKTILKVICQSEWNTPIPMEGGPVWGILLFPLLWELKPETSD